VELPSCACLRWDELPGHAGGSGTSFRRFLSDVLKPAPEPGCLSSSLGIDERRNLAQFLDGPALELIELHAAELRL
jgi:hypothetical protein